MDFTGKAIVITGATSGIGYDLLKTILQTKQCHVCAVGRNQKKLETLQQEFGSSLFTIQCDLKVEEQIDNMIKLLFTPTANWPGVVDIFIANAGYAYYEQFGAKNYDHVHDIYALNVIAPIYTLSQMLNYQKGKPFQYAITVSGLGRLPHPGYSLYASTKFALDGFIRSYRYEPSYPVTLSGIYPVAIRTPFYQNSPHTMKVPLLRQKIEANTRAIIKGIQKEQKTIIPSKLYQTFLFFRRFLPLTTVYTLIEKKRLQHWMKQNDKQ